MDERLVNDLKEYLSDDAETDGILWLWTRFYTCGRIRRQYGCLRHCNGGIQPWEMDKR